MFAQIDYTCSERKVKREKRLKFKAVLAQQERGQAFVTSEAVVLTPKDRSVNFKTAYMEQGGCQTTQSVKETIESEMRSMRDQSSPLMQEGGQPDDKSTNQANRSLSVPAAQIDGSTKAEKESKKETALASPKMSSQKLKRCRPLPNRGLQTKLGCSKPLNERK